MSFAKRFSIAQAMEEIKEDTTGEFVDPLEDQADEIVEIQEDIEFSADEIGKGLEAISDLISLSNKIEKNEGDGIAVENYSDIAQIAFESILSRIGLEDNEVFDKDDPTGKDAKDITPKSSGKIKQFIEKMIEVIKGILKKIGEFFKKIYEAITSRVAKTIKMLEDLNDSAKIAVLKAGKIPNIDIENPAFFKDKKLVTVEEIMGTTGDRFVRNYNDNARLFVNEVEDTNSNGVKNESAYAFVKKLDGKKSGDSIKVLPEGYIAVTKDSDINEINYIKETPDTQVEKQTLALVANFPNLIPIVLSTMNLVQENNEEMFKHIESKINSDTAAKLKDIQLQLKNSTPEKEEELRNKAKLIKDTLSYMTSVRKTHLAYTNDIIFMINYYTNFINQAANNAKA